MVNVENFKHLSTFEQWVQQAWQDPDAAAALLFAEEDGQGYEAVRQVIEQAKQAYVEADLATTAWVHAQS
ncbi:hypothetical protein [Pseudomonas serbica]